MVRPVSGVAVNRPLYTLKLNPEQSEAGRGLQRRIGLTIATASFVIVPFAFIVGITVGDSVTASLLHPSVSVVLLLGVLALVTAWKTGGATQLLQIAMVTAVVFLSALTSGTTELTSLLFFGIAIALSHAYGFSARQHRYYVAVVGVLLLGTIILRMRRLGVSTGWAAAQWVLGALMVLTLYLLILNEAYRRSRERHVELEKAVADGTRDLQDALRRSEELRLRNQELLRELQHRTKNNLQLIASMISLEQFDPRIISRSATEVLDVQRRRLESMATALDLMYRSDYSMAADLKELLRDLSSGLVHGGRVLDVMVDSETTAVDMPVAMEIVVPLGLMVTELIEFAMEQTNNDDGCGSVTITLERDDNTVMIAVEQQEQLFLEHNGVEDTVDVPRLQIINALAAQIHGRIEHQREPRTRWIVHLPMDEDRR